MFGFLRQCEIHHKREARPLLWTFGRADANDPFLTHIWLHNGTGTVLDRVTIGSGAFITVDDAAFSTSGGPTVYKDVQPDEAVRIDTRHDIYDSDYVLSTQIRIDLAGKPPLLLSTKASKGGSEGKILLRDG